MSFFKDVSIIGGFKDFVGFLRQGPKERIIPAVLSLLIPGIILFIFIIDSKINTAPPPGPKVTYFESWSLDRTDAEILVDRWAIQCLKDKQAAKRKEAMKSLGRMSGMDVEEIEREAEEYRAKNGIVEVKRPDNLTC